MLRLLLAFGLALAALQMPASLAAQDWSRYKPGSLVELQGRLHGGVTSVGGAEAPNWALFGQDFPTEARLVYTGDHRPLSAERREVLRRWQRSFGVDPKVLDLFPAEYRFTEGGTDLWLAVQHPLEEPLQAEARAGQPLVALVTLVGAHYAGGPVSWLFLMNEFDASAP